MSKLNVNSEQKNAYLKAMGIDVWLKREAVIPEQIPADESNDFTIQTLQKQDKELLSEPVVEIKPKSDIAQLDWQALSALVAECQACQLYEKRSQTVFGSGNKQAALMIITAAPDAEEELQGKPFVGDTGELLNAMLIAMGLQRKDVYITNINKCRPPENREPSEEETEQCHPYLLRQITLIQPELILVMGNNTAQRLLKNKSTIGRLRGQLHNLENISAPLIVTYHPAYLLKSTNEKRKAWEDLKMVMKHLEVIQG